MLGFAALNPTYALRDILTVEFGVRRTGLRFAHRTRTNPTYGIDVGWVERSEAQRAFTA